MKRPYRLATRAVLSPEPPFSPEMVRALILDSLRGPKRGYAKHGEPSADEMMYLSSTLNNRHAFFYAAQRDRARKDRRDRAVELIDELREIVRKIAKDAEEQRSKADDFFSRNAERAAKAVCGFISSDVVASALPAVTLPENVFGWQWCASSLYADVEAMIGANAAVRFIVAAIPSLTGESPKLSAVTTWLRKRHGMN